MLDGGAPPHHAAKHLIVKGRDDPPLNNLHAVREGTLHGTGQDRRRRGTDLVQEGNARSKRRSGGNKMWSILLRGQLLLYFYNIRFSSVTPRGLHILPWAPGGQPASQSVEEMVGRSSSGPRAKQKPLAGQLL